jgi:hypothetical protein
MAGLRMRPRISRRMRPARCPDTGSSGLSIGTKVLAGTFLTAMTVMTH